MHAFRLPRFTSLGLLALAALLALPAALVATPAQAKPIVRERYSGTDSGDFDCGGVVTLHFEGEFSGLFMLKQGRRGDPTPYFFDNYQYRFVYTTAGSARWFTEEGNGLYKDLRIVKVEGTVYTFEASNAGQQSVIRDEDGNALFRNRGRLLFRFVVDTKGDADLDNDEFIEGSFEVVAESGKHPFFEIDACQWAKDYLLG